MDGGILLKRKIVSITYNPYSAQLFCVCSDGSLWAAVRGTEDKILWLPVENVFTPMDEPKKGQDDGE